MFRRAPSIAQGVRVPAFWCAGQPTLLRHRPVKLASHAWPDACTRAEDSTREETPSSFPKVAPRQRSPRLVRLASREHNEIVQNRFCFKRCFYQMIASHLLRLCFLGVGGGRGSQKRRSRMKNNILRRWRAYVVHALEHGLDGFHQGVVLDARA